MVQKCGVSAEWPPVNERQRMEPLIRLLVGRPTRPERALRRPNDRRRVLFGLFSGQFVFLSNTARETPELQLCCSHSAAERCVVFKLAKGHPRHKDVKVV